MTKRSTLAPLVLVPLVLVVAVGVAACGGSDDGGEAGTGGNAGMSGSGGAAGTGGSAGMGGAGGMGDDDCSRICESPCVDELLPAGMVDDCIRSCTMGFFSCIPELIAALECIELIDCDILADPCLTESQALTTCLAGGG